VQERAPIHARDFASAVQKRAIKCKLHKRSIGKRSPKELDMNEAGKGAEVDIVGVNGCSGVFIWADTLYGVHAVPGEFQQDIQKLETLVGAQKSHITDVAISSPDTADEEQIKGLLSWTGKTPTAHNYPYVATDNKNIFTLGAKFSAKGQVTVHNDPLSRTPSPGSSGGQGH
jgi:hypothetical protein